MNELRLNRNIYIEKIKKFLIFSFLIIFAFIQIYPFLWLVLFSFKSNSEIFGGNIAGLPKEWLLSNYSDAIFGGKVLIYFLNSTLVTVLTIFLTLVVSAPAAYAIARLRWKLSRITMILFLLGLMIPVHASLLPLFMVFKNTKLLNTHWCLILPYTAFSMPFAIFVLNGFLQTIPKEMEESAFLDGCGVFKSFVNIIMPMVIPAVATISIVTYLFAWNELMFAITFISKTTVRTLTVGIQTMVGQYNTRWGSIGAGLVVSALPTIIIYSLMSGQVQKSLVNAGTLKG